MKVYVRLLSYAKPYRHFLIPFLVFTLIGIFFNVFQFALIIPLLNYLFSKDSGADAIKYVHAPEFHFSKSYFVDYFYYQLHHLKEINHLVALCIPVICVDITHSYQ